MSVLFAKKHTNRVTQELDILNQLKRSKRLEDLTEENHPIVRYEPSQTFYSIPWELLKQLISNPHHCHEVITFTHPFRMYFDIDEIIKKDACSGEFLESYLDAIIAYIREIFDSTKHDLDRINRTPIGTLDNPVIMTGCRKYTLSSYKLSFHIVYPNTIVYNRQVMLRFYNHLSTNNDYNFDKVYNKNKNFRMLNGIKDFYILGLASNIRSDILDTLVQVRSTWELVITMEPELEDHDIEQVSDKSYMCYIDQVVQRFETLHDLTFEQYSFSQDSNWKGIIRLTRVKSGFCKLCNRIHDSENASLSFYYLDDSLICTFTCYRNRDHRVSILVSGTDKMKFIDIEHEVEHINSLTSIDVQRSDEWEIPCSKITDDFYSLIQEPNRIVAFRGPTGCGKTHYIHQFLREELSKEDTTCVIISSRIAYTYQLSERFKDLNPLNYKETTGLITADCVIIQIDSLARLNLSYYDNKKLIVILDEINSIMFHSNGLMPRRYCDVIDSFHRILDLADKIIIADAYLQYEHLLPLFNCVSCDAVIGVSHKMPWSDRTMVVHPNESTFIDSLLEYDVKDRVAVTSITLKGLSGIYKLVKEKFPDLDRHSMVFTSETPRPDLKEAFKNITEAVKKTPRIFYTQTLGSGNDINMEMVMFVYIDNRQRHMTPHEVLQQLNRVRIRSPTHIFIKAFHSLSPCLDYQTHLDNYKDVEVFPFNNKTLSSFRLDLKSHFKVEWKVAKDVIASKSDRNFPREFFRTALMYGETSEIYMKHRSGNEIVDLYGEVQRTERLREIAEAIRHEENSDRSIRHYIDLYVRVCKFYKVKDIAVDEFIVYQQSFVMQVFKNLEILFSFVTPIDDDEWLEEIIDELSKKERDRILIADSKSYAKRASLLLMIDGLGFRHPFDSNENRQLNALDDKSLQALECAISIYRRASGNFRRQTSAFSDNVVRQSVGILRTHGIIVSLKKKIMHFDDRFGYTIAQPELYSEYMHYVNLMCLSSNRSINVPTIVIPVRFLDLIFKNNNQDYIRSLEVIRNKFLYTLAKIC